MSRQKYRKKSKQKPTSAKRRLSVLHRWKWGGLFAVSFGLILSPYVWHTIAHPDPAKTIVLLLVTGLGGYLFGVTVQNH